MPSRTRRTSRRSGARAKYLWENTTTTPQAIASLGTALVSLMPQDPNFVQPADVSNRDLVVVRMVGKVIVAPDVFTGFTDALYAFGILVRGIEAFNGGAANLLQPQVDQPGWVFQTSDRFIYEGTAGTQTSKESAFDVKGMRKIPKSDNLLMFILRNLGSATINVSLHIRVLYRLP